MKTILYITHKYLDSTKASGSRAARFIDGLVARGVRVVVITLGDKPRIKRKSAMITVCQITANGQLPPEAAGKRIKSWPIWRILPGPERGWRLGRAICKASHWLIEQEHIDLVLISGPPFSVIPVACQAAKEHNLPLIIELRDAWYTAMPWPYSGAAARRAAKRYEKSCLQQASRIITVTATVKKLLTDKYGHEIGEKIYTIRHGYDEFPKQQDSADNKSLTSLNVKASPCSASGVSNIHNSPDTPGTHPALSYKPFTIAYTGQLRGIDIVHRRSGISQKIHHISQVIRGKLLGASFCQPLRLDWMSPHYLMRALANVLEDNPGFSHAVRLVFVGERFDEIDQWAKQMMISGNVYQYGPTSPEAAQHIASNADLLVLSLYGIEGCVYHWCVPSKLYMYMGTGKPILAMLPPGEARDLVMRAGTGVSVAPDDVAAITEKLHSLITQHQEHGIKLKCDWGYVNRFKASHQQKMFSDVVLSVLG